MTEQVRVEKPRARERIVVNVDRPAARWIGALAVLSLFCWLVVLLARHHDHEDWNAAGRLAWSLTILTGVALIARGIFLGRPVTAAHATAALGVLVVGLGAHLLSYHLLGNVLVTGAGLVLMWPTAAPPQPQDLPRVWRLVNTSEAPARPVRHAIAEELLLQC